jgi:hypothetical protein
MKKALFAACLTLVLSLSASAQLAMESAVQLSLSHAPRSATRASTKTLSSGSLIAEMGLSGGSILCVGDAQDRTAAWTFKHRLSSKVKGVDPVETDLSDKLSMEVLGYSEVGAAKLPSPTAPKRATALGKVTSTQTVRLKLDPKAGFSSEFWGSLVVNYTVTQEANSTEASWVPGSMSMKLVGWSIPEEGALAGSAALTMTMGAFKRLSVINASSMINTSSIYGVDDFSNGIDPTLWPVKGTKEGSMKVVGVNGHASFLVAGKSQGEQTAYIVWNGRPRANADWTAEVRGHNEAAYSTKGGSHLTLSVADPRIVTTSRAGILHVGFGRGGGGWRGPEFQHKVSPGPDEPKVRVPVPLGTTDFMLRINYRASTQQFEVSYDDTGAGRNWNVIGTTRLSEIMPKAAATTEFIVFLVSTTSLGPITEGEIWADDFRLETAQ